VAGALFDPAVTASISTLAAREIRIGASHRLAAGAVAG
jgi:hypothetical protein